jgi:hypothetical protein
MFSSFTQFLEVVSYDNLIATKKATPASPQTSESAKTSSISKKSKVIAKKTTSGCCKNSKPLFRVLRNQRTPATKAPVAEYDQCSQSTEELTSDVEAVNEQSHCSSQASAMNVQRIEYLPDQALPTA